MLDVLHHPNEILNQVASLVTDFTGLDQHIEAMLETMYAGNGVGLAAPQVGDLRRIVLIDPSAGESAAALRVMINPIVEFESPDKDVESEGCLSLPGINVLVARSKVISVKYVDVNGVGSSVMLSGFSARVAQHELDHINGITLLDHIKRRGYR